MKKLIVSLFAVVCLSGCVELPPQNEFYTNIGPDGQFALSLIGQGEPIIGTTLSSQYQLTLVNQGENTYDVNIDYSLRDVLQTNFDEFAQYQATNETFIYNRSIQETFSLTGLDFSAYGTGTSGMVAAYLTVEILDNNEVIDQFSLQQEFFNAEKGRHGPVIEIE